ncbi:MAG: hypothetical protein K2G00_05600, partial [Duncaniella sp.]|nr:hypothetical protein [Duncaniella sp.]
ILHTIQSGIRATARPYKLSLTYLKPIEVYNLNGIKIADSTGSLPAGLYIVRHGNTVKKIAMK